MFRLRLEQLNISWCSFSRNHVQNLVETLSPSVTHLNLSGYRDSLALDGEEPEPGRNQARTPALGALQGRRFTCFVIQFFTRSSQCDEQFYFG